MSAARSRVLLEIDGLILQNLRSEASSVTRVEGTDNGKENIHGLIPSKDEDELLSDLTQRLVLSEKTPQSQREAQEGLSNNVANLSTEFEEDASSNGSYDEDYSEEDSEEDSEEGSEEDSGSEDEDDRNHNEFELLAAERVLSRTLAMANSDPDLGMAADIRMSSI